MVISQSLVEDRGFTTTEGPDTLIRFANGTTFKANRLCTVRFRKNQYVKDVTCAVAPIDDDIIFGIPWRESIEITMDNWAVQKLQFKTKSSGKKHCWYGHGRRDPLNTICMISCSAMQALGHQEYVQEVTIQESVADGATHPDKVSPLDAPSLAPTSSHQTHSPALSAIIAEYKGTFVDPPGLSDTPSRVEDMAIPTKTGAKIPCRPL
jgi:hypothetical protein